MKKFFSYILIVLIIVQLFAPFSVGFGVKNNLRISENKAVAEGCTIIEEGFTDPVPPPTSKETPRPDTVTYSIKTSPECVGKYFNFEVKAYYGSGYSGDTVLGPYDSYKTIKSENINLFLVTGEETCYGAECDRVGIWFYIKENIGDNSNLLDNRSEQELTYACGEGTCSDDIKWEIAGEEGLEGTSTTGQEGTTDQQVNQPASLPVCWLGLTKGGFSVSGCFAQFLYGAVFQTTSYLFGLTGKILDYTIMYSTSDQSYRSVFVVEGWGVIRDFCNMFFIFVLLYIALGTILGLHSVKTKEMIINVVIIGILINFSLFATQLIIDTSNILTRVFYNTNTISLETTGTDGKPIPYEYNKDEGIPISVAIVEAVNPVELITSGSEVDAIPAQDNNDKTKDGKISTGTFILITILATIVNIFGMIAFLSSALIFIARVIGLWFAMILAPLAFFSYTVPSLQDMKMIGWKKWWPDTLKMAFLGPVFMFFMYLIIGFMSKGFGIFDSETKTGMAFVIAILVPFVFMMILLMKAKSIAQDMSGEMGQTITKGIAAAGGVALGGAALGAAALGRGTLGAFMKGASTGDTAAQRLRAGDPTLSRLGRFKGRIQQWSGVDWAQRQVGGALNRNQQQINDATHSRHTLDQAANVVASGKKWDELNGQERLQARTNLERTVEMRNRGWGNRTWAQLSNAEQTTITGAINPRLATHTTEADTRDIVRARRKVGLGENIIQSTIGGSFDIRNLSKLVASEQDRGLNKFATGLTSVLASGMRGALKQSNIYYGEGQKNFVKDLGNTITDALKSTTLKVDLSHVGEEKKEGAHSGGGHH